MSEEKLFEIVTKEDSPAQQVPTINENLLDSESIDTVNQQPSSSPASPRTHQNLTHISHQVHSPHAWNFFSGEDIKAAAVPPLDGSKMSLESSFQTTQSSGEKSITIDQAVETPFTPSKGDDQNTSLGVQASPEQLFNLMFGQIPDTYRRQREVRRDSIGKRNEKNVYERPPAAVIAEERILPSAVEALDLREFFIERREREFDRREREIDRRERDLERRERELERRQREFDFDKGRINAEPRHYNLPQQNLQEIMEVLKKQIQVELSAERKKSAEREALFEEKVMKRVNDVLENERQLYGVMKMSDHEVNEMMERSVGYLLQNDEDIADRVRFQSLIYLTQERLASEAGLQPPQGTDSFSLSWRLALGPSVVTEERHNKALELLKSKDLQETTKKVVECKRALEYAVEYTSHLRKEGTEMSDHSFSLGRIPRKDYMESVERHSKGNTVEYEALRILVDFICPEL